MSTKMYLTFLGIFAYFAINTANAALGSTTKVIESHKMSIAYAIEVK